MGVLNLFKLINGSQIQLSDISGKKIGIDGSFEIYRLSLGVKKSLMYEGKSTTLTYLFMNKIIALKKLNISIIIIFDNPKANLLKIKENKKRKENKLKNMDKNVFNITTEIIDEIKLILQLMGIDYCTALENCEAEKLGAYMVKYKLIDYFITNDSDTLTFGSHNIIRNHTQDGKKIYTLYELKNILDNLNVSYHDFVKICVILGCDFCKKTNKIGIKSVLRKYKDVELTEEQKIAYNYFIDDCVFDPNSVIVCKYDKPAFLEYVKRKGINIYRLEHKLSYF